MNNRPIDDHSSETYSHPININIHTYTFKPKDKVKFMTIFCTEKGASYYTENMIDLHQKKKTYYALGKYSDLNMFIY
jgi:hypothetical protein